MRAASWTIGAFLALAVVSSLTTAMAQAPGVPIETLQPLTNDEQILGKAAVLREAGELLSAEDVAAQLVSPTGGAVALAEPSQKRMSGRELAQRAREAYLRLGWYYRCKRCEKWHLQVTGAYAIAPDAIATCHHCVVPGEEMREGYLIAVDQRGNVLPVTGVIAQNAAMDCAILRVKGGEITVLAVQDNVAPGDPAFCFSEPLGQHGYFTMGIVNRFFWKPTQVGKPGSLEELAGLRVNVSTDWAPGSSGAAVLDECGNAIGHVSQVAPMGPRSRAEAPPPKAKKDALAVGDEKAVAPPKETRAPERAVLIILHEAIPARGVRALARSAAPKNPAEVVEP